MSVKYELTIVERPEPEQWSAVFAAGIKLREGVYEFPCVVATYEDVDALKTVTAALRAEGITTSFKRIEAKP